MKVDDAIKNIKMFHFKNLPRFKPELINLLKSLQAENKALKKENEEYKGMWRWLSVKWGCSILDNSTPADFTLDDAMNLIETEYLGGGE